MRQSRALGEPRWHGRSKNTERWHQQHLTCLTAPWPAARGGGCGGTGLRARHDGRAAGRARGVCGSRAAQEGQCLVRAVGGGHSLCTVASRGLRGCDEHLLAADPCRSKSASRQPPAVQHTWRHLQHGRISCAGGSSWLRLGPTVVHALLGRRQRLRHRVVAGVGHGVENTLSMLCRSQRHVVATGPAPHRNSSPLQQNPTPPSLPRQRPHTWRAECRCSAASPPPLPVSPPSCWLGSALSSSCACVLTAACLWKGSGAAGPGPAAPPPPAPAWQVLKLYQLQNRGSTRIGGRAVPQAGVARQRC